MLTFIYNNHIFAYLYLQPDFEFLTGILHSLFTVFLIKHNAWDFEDIQYAC